MVFVPGETVANTTIVCYTGGTAGDIVSVILDPSDLSKERQRLKKPHQFSNNQEKDTFLATAQWLSVPSHDFEYHRSRKHDILAIVCRQKNQALWAAERFKKIHRPHVWEEMTQHCGANDIETYAQMIMDFGSMVEQYSNNVLYLDDILSGQAVDKLNAMGYVTPGTDQYRQWLSDNTKYT